jgi:hypothetical protein
MKAPENLFSVRNGKGFARKEVFPLGIHKRFHESKIEIKMKVQTDRTEPVRVNLQVQTDPDGRWWPV